jgi:hypothetical protein
MKNPHLTFYRKENRRALTVRISKLVAKETENVESLVVTYPRCTKSACCRSQSLVRPIRNRQVVSSTSLSAAFFAQNIPTTLLRRVAHCFRPELPCKFPRQFRRSFECFIVRRINFWKLFGCALGDFQ